MIYRDTRLVVSRDPRDPAGFRRDTCPPIEDELYHHTIPPGCLPTDRFPGQPTEEEIAGRAAEIKARHIAARVAGKAGGGIGAARPRGPRVVRMSREARGLAECLASERAEVEDMTGRGMVGEGGW